MTWRICDNQFSGNFSSKNKQARVCSVKQWPLPLLGHIYLLLTAHVTGLCRVNRNTATHLCFQGNLSDTWLGVAEHTAAQALRRLMQEDHKFEARLNYGVNFKPVWATWWNPVSKSKPKQRKIKQSAAQFFYCFLPVLLLFFKPEASSLFSYLKSTF